ncbi:MAG: HAMP domain-containing protein [Candidatus Latescibacteria bacterium]|nr:HAMP domain-containing protein [Candidatus Latescibacterota bacterium]
MRQILNSLYGRIAAIFLVLLLVLGLVQSRISLSASMEFAAETDQKLNRNLAADLAKRFAPYLQGDKPDYYGIKHSFHDLMVMNPRVEIYLLEEDGTISAYFAPEEKIKRQKVDMAPVLRFIESPVVPLPIYGDDPRSPDRQKPFSATPVYSGSHLCYLYVILGGEDYDSHSAMLESSYILKSSSWVLGGVFLSTGLAGLIIFFLLTKRLRSITATVGDFAQGDYQQRIAPRQGDEMGQLGQAFNQMADTIVATMDQLKRNDNLRRELVANVSHDLRTPLANIQGYLETVLMREAQIDAEERRRFLDIIYHNVTMLGRLIDELFELSKLDARQTEPDLEAFSLPELVQDIIVDFRSQADKSDVRLETDFAADLPFARADIGMIERVLTNLLENALQYTSSGGRIALRLAPAPMGIQVEVADTGQGIPAPDLPHIFDRFYRVDKGRSSVAGGTGLGLAIAQKMIQAHGSTIAVESQLGQGTAFSFILPYHQEATSPPS